MAVQGSIPRTIQRLFKGRMEDREERRDNRERVLLLIAACFVFTNSIAFSLAREGRLSWTHLWAPLIWFATILISHLIIARRKPKRDPYLLPLFAFLTGWSLLLQDRLAPNFLSRQVLWFLIGAVSILLVTTVPRTLAPLQRYRYLLLFGGLILMGITLLFGVNPSGSGAELWLSIPLPIVGRVFLQPSELLKVLLVIFLASYFTEQEPLYHYRRQHNAAAKNKKPTSLSVSIRNQLPFLGPLLLMWGFTILLLVWQQDLGAAALFFLVFIALLYLATGSLIYVIVGFLLLALAGGGLFFFLDTVVTPRLISWINPWSHASTYGYQIVQSLIAQAAGGVIGQGIGQGFPDFIPVVHSDFALAAIAEEWGLIGSLAIVMFFAILAQRGLRIALDATLKARSNLFHAYLAAGFSVVFSIQAFLIMGGVTKLLPLTGITLPMVSYGGSSLLVSSLMIGLLLFLSAEKNDRPTTIPSPFQNTIKIELSDRIEKLGAVILLSFLILAMVMTYWAVWRSETLLAREDNPRLVETERRIQRGRILDRDGNALAETISINNTPVRLYPVQESGPAVGYYDIRYGTAGVEQVLNSFLQGTEGEGYWQQAWRELLHIPATGQDVRLTLDADLQSQATRLMTGQTGGLVLLELTEEGRSNILAMVSQPGYDPNQLAARFEELSAGTPGPLFNRATQGLYQPGLLLQPLVIAAGIEDGWIQPGQPIQNLNRPVTFNGSVLRCRTRPSEEPGQGDDWSVAVAFSCPGPLYELGQEIGPSILEDIFDRFGLTREPDFVLPVALVPSTTVIADPGMAAIGQEQLTVTPLQMAIAYTALAGDGQIKPPVLLESIRNDNNEWVSAMSNTQSLDQWLISADTAAITRNLIATNLATRGTTAVVLSGPDGDRDAWYAGMAPIDSPRYVVALVLENETDPVTAEAIGRALLESAISQP